MVAIAATSYATQTAQAWQSRSRLQQARREADQAESDARQLRQQADQAELQAQRSQTRVGALAAEVAREDHTYSARPSATAKHASGSGRLVDALA
jgi:multidrug efflux pump subunit AcrA (membrane-fusion protein)